MVLQLNHDNKTAADVACLPEFRALLLKGTSTPSKPQPPPPPPAPLPPRVPSDVADTAAVRTTTNGGGAPEEALTGA